ncbi:MAG: Hsp33 family molecular chaperone HslO, partial [Halioglobus sp.]
ELVELDAGGLLYRLYHDEKVRLFDPADVQFYCSCSVERSRNALSVLDRAEIEEILTESGVITVDCEFCNQQYRFERGDLGALLGDDESKTLH